MVPIRWRRRGWAPRHPGSSRVIDLYAQSHPNADAGTCSCGCPDPGAFANPGACPNFYSDAYAHGHSNRDAYPGAYAYSNTCPNSYANIDANANRDTYTDSHTHAHTTYTDSHTPSLDNLH